MIRINLAFKTIDNLFKDFCHNYEKPQANTDCYILYYSCLFTILRI